MSFYDIPKQNKIVTGLVTVILLVAIGIVIAMSTAVSKVSTQDEPQSDAENQPSTEKAAEPTVAVTANYAAIVTDFGNIIMRLYPDDAPKTVKNFATLAKTGYYNGLLFHRVAKDFVIQGGDPNGDGSGGESIYGATFEDEINADSLGLAQDVKDLYQALYGYQYRKDITSHHVVAGSLAMANRGANTNGSQFFIVTKSDQPGLDGKHTVFGEVVDGMSVVDQINNVEVGHNDRPASPVIIKTVLTADDEEGIRNKVNEYKSE